MLGAVGARCAARSDLKCRGTSCSCFHDVAKGDRFPGIYSTSKTLPETVSSAAVNNALDLDGAATGTFSLQFGALGALAASNCLSPTIDPAEPLLRNPKAAAPLDDRSNQS